MSHTRVEPARPRLQRSELAVPGSNPAMFRKALESEADVVFLDLEDAVAPADKEQARRNVIAALLEYDWREAGKTISVRVNGIDTHYFYRDVVDVVEQAGHRLDTVLVPKVGVPADVYLVDALLTQIEAAQGIPHRIGIEVLIETALGMANVEAVAQGSRRLEAMHFGVADYAASCRARTVTIGGLNPDYPGDPWHAALSRLIVACRAYGLRAIDGPFGGSGARGGAARRQDDRRRLRADGPAHRRDGGGHRRPAHPGQGLITHSRPASGEAPRRRQCRFTNTRRRSCWPASASPSREVASRTVRNRRSTAPPRSAATGGW
jgi:citrate lyase beta subunit